MLFEAKVAWLASDWFAIERRGGEAVYQEELPGPR